MSRRGAFTLVEMILVLVVIGLAASLIAVGVAGRSRGAEQRRALGWMVAELATARIEAMRRGESVTAEVTLGGGRARVRFGERSNEWPARGLLLADASGAVMERGVARFESSGRCGARRWQVLARGSESESLSSGRIRWIEFDPVSGAVSLSRGEFAGVPASEEVHR